MNLERELVKHGAPTLAGLKTGNLFTLRPEAECINGKLRELNRQLRTKGVRLIPLRRTGKSMLVYLYRPDRLEEDLVSPEAEGILKEKGYACGDVQRCITCLIRHLASDESFPHEIGLFLGYPPSDVRCFMRDSREGVKCTGCWKAYDHPQEAEKIFTKYKKCTDVYCRQFDKGRSLDRLTVASRPAERNRRGNKAC